MRQSTLIPPEIDPAWTPRQRQVLDLLVRGRTNGQIAEELGISLEGAKFHVSEILSKLGAASREEAADYWRHHNGMRTRFLRFARTVFASAPLRWAGVASAAGAAIGVAFVLVLVANREGDTPAAIDPSPTPTPTATPTAAGVVPPMASPSAVTPTPAPSPTPAPAVREIVGLFDTPRAVESDIQRDVPTQGADFPEWNRESAVIYDIANGTTIDLGPGTNVEWAPDGRRGVWIALADDGDWGGLGRATLIDLHTGGRKDLGPARLARFVGEESVLLAPTSGNIFETLDLRTGQRTPIPYWYDPGVPRPSPHYLEHVGSSTHGTSIRFGGDERKTFEVRETATDSVLYRFEAYAAVMADAKSFVVATVPAGGLQDLRTNVFLVDIASGRATYVATALASPDNWPLRASERWVAWTDAYCIYEQPNNTRPGTLRMFDRQTGEVTELRDPSTPSGTFAEWFELTADGRLQIGAFSGGRILDPETMQYDVQIDGIHVNWTHDYAYASQGQYGGHGGLCAG